MKATIALDFVACPVCGEETPAIRGVLAQHGALGAAGDCAGSGGKP